MASKNGVKEHYAHILKRYARIHSPAYKVKQKIKFFLLQLKNQQ